MTTLDLFDHAAAQAAKAQALDRVEANADEAWLANALGVVRELAKDGHEFTSDDVWRRVPAAAEPRALGAVMTTASKRGLIKETGRYQNSIRPVCHKRPVKIWKGATA